MRENSNGFITCNFSTSILAPGPPSYPNLATPAQSAISEHSGASKNGPFNQRLSAKTHGTKYHNPPPPKKWREAISDDGNTYFWHVESYGKTYMIGIVLFPKG